MKLEGSLPCSKERATGPYHEPVESSRLKPHFTLYCELCSVYYMISLIK
jgi:hypothetical protein